MKFFTTFAALALVIISGVANAQTAIAPPATPSVKITSKVVVTDSEVEATPENPKATKVHSVEEKTEMTKNAMKFKLELAKLETKRAIEVAKAEAKAKQPQGCSIWAGCAVMPYGYGGYYGSAYGFAGGYGGYGGEYVYPNRYGGQLGPARQRPPRSR